MRADPASRPAPDRGPRACAGNDSGSERDRNADRAALKTAAVESEAIAVPGPEAAR